MAVANLPVIDVSDPNRDDSQIAHDLVEAAIEHGFIYIKNTGRDIPVDAVDAIFGLSRKLFAAPHEEKQQCKIQKNNLGWAGMQSEQLDPSKPGDFKEAFNTAPFFPTTLSPSSSPLQPFPPTITPHLPHLSNFQSLCHTLSLRLLSLLSLGLATSPPTYLVTPHLSPSPSILRLLYYPPLPFLPSASLSSIRAGAHSDYGSITMLFRLKGQAGLEIQLPDGKWAPVPVCPPGTEDDPAPPVLVNVGDLLSYWTGGLLRSTVHRVVFRGGEEGVEGERDDEARYSVAWFCHPEGETELRPVPSERVKAFQGGDGKVEKMRVITADEHLQMRLKASYVQLYGDDDKAQ